MLRTLFVCFAIGCLSSVLIAEDVLPVPKRNSLTPPVPGKVVRYAQIFMRRYDTNGDGILQREEWEKIPGTPQAMDMDGDGQITMEEIVWYFAQYGQTRTIHRTVVVDLSEPYKFDPANLQLFRPFLQPAAVPSSSDAGIQTHRGDATEAMIKANEQLIDDAVYEKMVLEGQIPSERPFYALSENLRGVPVWFVLLDKNGDGQISLSEFAPTLDPVAVELFKRLDKNGNGFIEPDEVRVP
jgi:hypothetical protein